MKAVLTATELFANDVEYGLSGPSKRFQREGGMPTRMLISTQAFMLLRVGFFSDENQDLIHDFAAVSC